MNLKVNRSLRRRLLLCAHIAAGVLILLLFTSHSPGALRAKRLISRLDEQRKEIYALTWRTLPKAEKDLSKARSLITSYEQLQSSYDAALQRIPTRPEIGTLLSELEFTAKRAGVNFVRVTSDEPRGTGKFGELPIEVTVVCGFYQLERFMSGVEGMNRLLRIELLDVESIAPATDEVKAEFYVKGYIRNEGGRVE
jgi:Tfp pilus assembly protein PilO